MSNTNKIAPYEHFSNSGLYSTVEADLALITVIDENAALKAKIAETDASQLQQIIGYWQNRIDGVGTNSDMDHIRAATDPHASDEEKNKLQSYTSQLNVDQSASQLATSTVQSLVQQEQNEYSNATNLEPTLYQMNISADIQLLQQYIQALGKM